jgi:hypothetical protein
MITVCENPIIYLFAHIGTTIGILFAVILILMVITEFMKLVTGLAIGATRTKLNKGEYNGKMWNMQQY